MNLKTNLNNIINPGTLNWKKWLESARSC